MKTGFAASTLQIAYTSVAVAAAHNNNLTLAGARSDISTSPTAPRTVSQEPSAAAAAEL
jgi:hypothetical protein